VLCIDCAADRGAQGIVGLDRKAKAKGDVMKNWKTTACGIAGLIGVLGFGAQALLDGDPATNVDLGMLFAAIAVVFPSLGNILAKDAKKDE